MTVKKQMDWRDWLKFRSMLYWGFRGGWSNIQANRVPDDICEGEK